METGRIIKLAGTIIVVIFLLVAFFQLVEVNGAGNIMVIQYPTGSIAVFTTQGPKAQWFGHVEKYKKRTQFWFSLANDQGNKKDESIGVRFNDGGHGKVSGSIAWEMPLARKYVLLLHTKYGSQEAIETQLIRTIMEKCIYMTGPLMSSKESFAERRNDLLTYIEDQVKFGVYKTATRSEKQPDPMTGVMKTVNVVQIVQDKNGLPARADESPLKEFGIRTFNLSINKLPYDTAVEKQITAQQEATMEVQTAIAEAKKAEQAAITAEKNGQAEAAKAKWEQEVIKAKAVTLAQQEKEVALLNAQAAAQKKIALTLEGQGEGAKRRAIMQADGGLELKLKAWVDGQKIWAEALKGYGGAIVPLVNMGGSTKSGGGFVDFMNVMTAKSALDLGVSLKASGASQTRGDQ